MNNNGERLHICFVSQEYPPDTAWGGISSYVREMALALVAAGHHVVVLSRALEKESSVVEDGVHVYRILPRKGLGSVHALWRLQKYWDGYRYAVANKLDEIVSQHQIDIIEVPDIRAETVYYQLTRRARPPVVVKLHTPRWLVDKLSGTKPDFWNRFEYFIERISIKKADAVYACSNSLLEACKFYLPKRKYGVVHNPIQSDYENSKKDDGNTVLYVGRLEWRKGVQVFERVIPRIAGLKQEAAFVFLGQDAPWHGGESLKKYVLDSLPQEMKHKAVFSGNVTRLQVREHLRKAAVCVLPSLWENFPYACLEAMSCGCVVIGSRNGGMSEMIEDGVSGYLVDPQDDRQIADRILQLLRDAPRRSAMGEAAVQRVRKYFSSAAIAAQTVDVYREALSRRRLAG